ncbi:MAG: hypothetical protein RL757_1589 [Bacteroidota bacterium]
MLSLRLNCILLIQKINALSFVKKIDKYLVRAFIPPFLVSFGIALFVLVMQFLWVYIDEIMGKGLGIFEIVELIFYLSMTFVPMALPLGVLIASVMVMGNMAEQYELSSMKSAGVSLLRVMRPMAFSVSLVVLFSVYCAEILIPWANLKFYSRFYDIRRAKPSISIEAGVFNDEFSDYTMRVAKKSADGRHLENVMIYANKGGNINQINQTTAKDGEMFTTPDKQFIVMKLNDGTQYMENGAAKGGVFPFVRLKFKSWQRAFDLTQFERGSTGEDPFKSHQKMQDTRGLLKGMDSIKRQINNRFNDLRRETMGKYNELKPINERELQQQKTDTTQKIVPQTSPYAPNVQDSMRRNPQIAPPPVSKPNFINVKPTRKYPKHFYDLQRDTTPDGYRLLLGKAQTAADAIANAAKNASDDARRMNRTRENFHYELHLKYANAFVCLFFLFIGAPMGAIIQKGGFGYPILVAIIFFIVYIISVIFFRNALKDSLTLTGTLAAWSPCLVLLPVGIVLTYRAINDYKLNNFQPIKSIQNFFAELKTRFPKKKTT